MVNLDAWLDDPDASPYLLLAAPAGRGKSALLVRWYQHLLERDDIAVIFLPVSIRFRTNLASVVFEALTAGLASFYGETLSVTPNMAADKWCEMASSYLARPLPDDRELLVILDGIDEAADWKAGLDLFSLSPPAGLRILISARHLAGDTDPSSWLGRLGWERPGLSQTFELNTLTHKGIVDVLKCMGLPLADLSIRTDFVAELHRLSEGDPLLVRLYVDDLRDRENEASRFESEDLRRICPGLAGYFTHWWDDQRHLWGETSPLQKKTVQTIVNLLSYALGPLSQDDLLALAPPQIGLSSWTLKETLLPLARFIIGDGSHDQGYVFSHPRLATFFFEQLSAHEREAIESSFLFWGKETLVSLNKKQLLPENASPYLIQYYGTHLVRTNSQPEDLLSLVGDGWRQAWYQIEGAYSGFLEDIQRAWHAAEATDEAAIKVGNIAPYLAGEVYCALSVTSIKTLATNIPTELLLIFVQEGVWTPAQGLSYAKQISEEVQRACALIALIPHLPVARHEEASFEALRAVRCIEFEWSRAETLAALASRVSETLLAEALEMAMVMEDNASQAKVIAALAPHLPEALLADTLETVRGMPPEVWSRAEAFAALAPYLPESLLVQALTVVWGILEGRTESVGHYVINPSSQLKTLTALAPRLPEALLAEALAAVPDIRFETSQELVLEVFAPYLPKTLFNDALTVARGLQCREYRAKVLVALAPHLPDTERVEVLNEALAEARGTWNKGSTRSEALTAVALYLSEGEREEVLAESLTEARSIQSEAHRAKTLAALVPHMPDSNREEVLVEALAAIQGTCDKRSQVEVLVALAPHLPEPLLDEALAMVWGMPYTNYEAAMMFGMDPYSDKDYRAEVLTALAPHLSETLLIKTLKAIGNIEPSEQPEEALAALAPHFPGTLLDEALTVVQSIQSNTSRVKALIALAPNLSKTERRETLTKFLAEARSILNEEKRAEVLAIMAPHLPEALLDEALTAALGIWDMGSRAKALAVLAPILPESRKEEALTEALTAVSGILDEEYQLQALVALAPHLPEIEKEEALTKALAAARCIEYPAKAIALAALGPYLREALLDEAMEMARRFSVPYRIKALIALAPNLSETEREEALAEALTEVHGIAAIWQAEALTTMAPFLPNSLLDEAMAVARDIQDDKSRVEALIALASNLSETEREEALAEALTEVHGIAAIWQAEALTTMAPFLPNSLLDEAMAVARDIQDDNSQIEALTSLASNLSKTEREEALTEALALARDIQDDKSRIEALTTLASNFSETEREEVLAEALTEVHGIAAIWQAEALTTMAPFLPNSLLDEAMAVAWDIQDDESQVEALIALAPILSQTERVEVLTEALTVARGIQAHEFVLFDLNEIEAHKVGALTDLIPQLPEAERTEVIAEALKATGLIDDNGYRVEALAALAPHLAILPTSALYAFWTKMLHVLASQPRKDLLVNLAALRPFAIMLGGEKVLVDIFHQIQDVTQWWQ